MLGNGLDIGSNYVIYILVGRRKLMKYFVQPNSGKCTNKKEKKKKKNKARVVGRTVRGGYNFKLSGYH